MKLWRRREAQPARVPANKGQTYPADHLRKSEIYDMLKVLDRRTHTFSYWRDRTLIITLWRTGLRVSEALDLLPQDVDLDAQTLRVMRGKGGKARTIGLDTQTVEVLERYRAERGQRPSGTPLFCNTKSGRMTATYVRNMLKRTADMAGVERRVHPHIFRHTYTIELVESGVSPAHIQQLLGHSSLGVTSAYVRSLNPAGAIEAARNRSW